MKFNKLGFSDLVFSCIGFGTWALGGGGEWGWGAQNDKDSVAAIQHAIDLGINWIDTAASYGHGRSEEIVGQAIKGQREKVLIATKGGIVWDENKNNFFRLKSWSIRNEIEDSLRRLDIDYIDLYQIHWNSPDEDLEEAWTEIARFIEAGKVRYAGVSNWTISQIERAQPILPVTSVQPKYNLLDREIEDDLLDYCRNNNIGVIVYSPLASGLFTNKMSKEWASKLPDDDWRSRNNPHFQEPEFSKNLKLNEKLKVIADRHGKTISDLAIAWTLRRPEITSAIVGARNPKQIEQNLSAANWELDDETQVEIEALLDGRKKSIHSGN